MKVVYTKFSEKHTTNIIGYIEVALSIGFNNRIDVENLSYEELELLDESRIILDTHEVEYIGKDNPCAKFLLPEHRLINLN